MNEWLNKTHVGDCRALLSAMAADGVRAQTCVTSPPYWCLRDYGMEGQIGLEGTVFEWVDTIVDVMTHVWNVLADDGTLWLNLGDSYSSGGRGGNSSAVTSSLQGTQATQLASMVKRSARRPEGLKDKELIGLPWRAAFALQSAGWYLRSDIIWSKPNPMPESVTDRPTKAHEYLFLFSKSERYYYDSAAIKEPGKFAGPNGRQKSPHAQGFARRTPEQEAARQDKQRGHGRRHAGFNDRWDAMSTEEQCSLMRNKRSVWTVSPMPQPEAHFATFPPELIEPCILAGAPAGGVVLDPFMGSGTTARVATSLGRQFIGCELNPMYTEIQNKIGLQAGMAL